MPPVIDKLENAKFYPAPCGLLWLETVDRDLYADGEHSSVYDYWFLVDPATDRMLVNIDCPTSGMLCFTASAEGGTQRKFISLDGAKRWAVSVATEIVNEEKVASSANRKRRRLERILKTK